MIQITSSKQARFHLTMLALGLLQSKHADKPTAAVQTMAEIITADTCQILDKMNYVDDSIYQELTDRILARV